MRYIYRNEFFGGIIYDTLKKDYYYLDNLAAAVLKDPATVVLENFNATSQDFSEVQKDLVEFGFTKDSIEFLDNKTLEKGLSAPLRVFYEITNRCTETCIHCYTSSGPKVRVNELNLAQKFSIIDQLRSMGCFRISIAGGEPLLDPEFFPFIEYAVRNQIDVSFSTNGVLITEEVANKLDELDIRTINISLDGWDEESFGVVRGKHRLPKVLKGIENLRKFYKNKIAAKVTLMSTNIRNLDKIIDLSISLGLDSIKFNCVRASGRANDNSNLWLSQDEYINTLKHLADLYEVKSKQISIVLPVNPFKDADDEDFIGELGFGCYAGKESFCINPVGDIQPCSSFGPLMYVDGNVRTKNLEDAWLNGESIGLFRGLDGSDSCKGCKSYNGCRGGCYLRGFQSTGQINGLDPYCYEYKNLS